MSCRMSHLLPSLILRPFARACPAAVLFMVVLTSPALAQQGGEGQVAVLQGLDKITARITTIDAPVGQPVRFGTLDITVRRCHKRPPEETPETTVYLQIRELRLGERVQDLFAGWMFASSPAVSSMEHPVYDVWVVDCKNLSNSG